MATIATLAVDLVANTKKFILPSKQIQGFASDVKSASLKIAGLASAITPLLAGAGITALVKQQYEAVDATAKVHDGALEFEGDVHDGPANPGRARGPCRRGCGG